jgi:signal transduction histidine kinase
MVLNTTGMSEDNIVGQKCYDIFHCKTCPDGCPLEKSLTTNKMETAEMEILTLGGTFLVSCIPIFNDQSQIEKIIHIATDISEYKRAEAEKQRLEERLQRAEKMEALGTLAGGVAHDLNNVLGVIIGYAELLQNEVDKSSPIMSRITKIINGTEKAAAIVQELLTLARRGVSSRQALNLNKLILDHRNSPAIEELLANNSAVRVKIDLEPDLLNISGSSVHLGKVFTNLVANALDAMPKGGDLTIRTANQYLDIPIHGYDSIRVGDYVVLSARDTGDGIAASDMQRIFEPFYTKKVMGKKGTGLGLAVVWGTVKDHNGYINVQSEKGKGSTFTIYFPVTREDIIAESTPVSLNEYRGKGETILVVDDDGEQRELATEMLEKLNYRVFRVACGEEAIAYVKENKVDLLVLDMIMDPGIDGLDTYKGVLKINRKQKAIIVSGFSDSERVHAAHVLGAGEYIKKPYVLEKLGMVIRTELDKR